MARSPGLLACPLLALWALSVPHIALAQEPSSADRVTARTLAQEGYEALRAREFAKAADRFTRANALVRAPTLLRDLARAQIGLGHLVDAHETYTQIIREGVPADAPAPWGPALEDAKQELALLTPRLPWITISVAGPAHPRVTIDGAPISESSLGVKRPADPGAHELRALAPGYHTAKKSVVLREGSIVKVAFELEEAPPDAPTKSEEAAGKVSVATVEDPGWVKPLTIGAFALGGVGIAVGSATGILAITKHNQLAAACAGSCGLPQKSTYDAYHTLGAISTIGFVAGGIGLGTGVVLLLVKPKVLVLQEPTATASRLRWSPFVSVGSAGVVGSF
jgi:hypothetical protein